MNDSIHKVNLPDSPYPGIESFSYADRYVFFAREAEARTLIRLIVMYRGVLLYSDSGTGKSSLVNARLLPLAIDEGYQPERIRIQPKRGEEIIVERVSEKVSGEPPFLPSIFASDEQQEDVVLSAEEFLETLRQRAGAARPLLIFDQFEEWITLFEEGSAGQSAEAVRASQESIQNAIVSLINDRVLPVKVLIVLREDYLAKLAPLFERCPSLPDQYLRLLPLKGDQIYQAIRGPFEKYPERYRPEVSPSLAKKIQTQFEDRSGGGDIRLTEVQIVCRSLFESGKQGPELDQVFTDQGGVPGTLEMYYVGALESLEKDQQEPAVALLSRMLTSAGTRNVISEDDLLDRVENKDGIPRELLTKTLDSLEQEAGLVRSERRREVYYYEIASEFLVEWIREKAQERKLLAEQRKAAKEAAEREREAARERERQLKLAQAQALAEEQATAARRLRGLAVALAVMLLLAVAATVVMYDNFQKASDNLRYADEQYRTAVAAQAATEAERNSVAALAANLEAILTVQAPSVEVTPEPPTATPVPLPTDTPTGLFTPSPEASPTATPTPTPKPPTPTPNQAATATVEAVQTQLAQVKATQTAVAQDQLARYKVGWLDIDMPVSMAAGQTVTARLRLLNEGNTTWARTGDHRVRLGYRWYTPAGQELDLADIRTSVPSDVKPSWLVVFEEAQVQAPLTPGEYILRWDMIEEPDTWFWKQGSPREDIHIEVQSSSR